MNSIKSKMLLSFCAVAAISIIALAAAVSIKIRENLLALSGKLTANLIEQTYDTLKTPHQTFELLIREEIQHGIFDMRNTPTLVADFEAGRLKALDNDLAFAAQKHAIDFAIVVNFKGQLEASFPARLDDFAIEKYITSWDFGRDVLQRAAREDSNVQIPIWETFAHHDRTALHTLGLDNPDFPEAGALGIVAASIIKNDFAEPLGILFAGKLLNNYQEPLQRLHAIAGYASAIYIQATPIALAGFPVTGESDGEMQPFQIPSAMQADVYRTGRSTARTLSVANDAYLTACSALTSFNDTILGMLCIGLPEVHVTSASQTILDYGAEARRNVYGWILLIGSVSLGFFALVSLAVATRIVTPIKQLSFQAKKIAMGDVQEVLPHTSRDEIGELSASLREVVNALRDVSATSEAIAVGHVQQQIEPRSEHDALGHALQYMAAYLQDMADMAETIALGDLTRSVHVRSDGDVLGFALQSMTEGLRALILQIKGSMRQLTATEANIATLANNQMRIVMDVHAATQDMVGTMTGMRLSVEEVAQSMEMLSASVEETSASVTQLTHSIAQIASSTTNLTQQTHQTIEHIQHVVVSVERIAEKTDTSERLSGTTMRDALEGQQAVEHVRTSMEIIQMTMTTAVDAITRFSQRSQEIDKILEVIREITDRTSLLALNASIIAAQAGAHGRGFAVVAEEMKSLSNGVAVSTKDIAAIVKSLQQDTHTVVQTVHDGVKDVQNGMARAQDAEEMLHKIIASARRSSMLVVEIAEALRGLIDISHRVSLSMDQVNAMTDDITLATSGQKAGTGQIHEAIFHINAMTSQIRQATIEQLQGVQHVLESTDTVTALIDENLRSSQQITEISADLSSQAAFLLHAVDRFKLPSP